MPIVRMTAGTVSKYGRAFRRHAGSAVAGGRFGIALGALLMPDPHVHRSVFRTATDGYA
jgi:hypothetical protein